MKLSFIVGNGNQGYQTRMCVYSFMKFNKDNIDEILISDNSSTDYSVQFFKENKYKDITKILTYSQPRDLDPTVFYPHGEQWDLALKNCKNEYAVISHADVEWKGNYTLKFLEIAYEQKPFMFGYGHGGIESTKSRIHEWGMIINVQMWKDLGISFEGRFNSIGAFDTACYLYRQALQKGLKIFYFNDGHWDDNNWFRHYCAGAKFNKEQITRYAMGWNE